MRGSGAAGAAEWLAVRRGTRPHDRGGRREEVPNEDSQIVAARAGRPAACGLCRFSVRWRLLPEAAARACGKATPMRTTRMAFGRRKPLFAVQFGDEVVSVAAIERAGEFDHAA